MLSHTHTHHLHTRTDAGDAEGGEEERQHQQQRHAELDRVEEAVVDVLCSQCASVCVCVCVYCTCECVRDRAYGCVCERACETEGVCTLGST